MRIPYLSLLPIMSTAASPTPITSTSPVHWLLAGDSTTAPGGGWGDAFLSTTVAPGSSGANYGHSGATTASFRAGGDWDRVLSAIAANRDAKRVYVTIQFGHNDQKPASNVSLPVYTTNLLRFAREAEAAGATPILLTPLTRRTFSGGDVVQNLANETAATLGVARANGVKVVDVNALSTAYVQKIGQVGADGFNLAAGDRTHLNEVGGKVFARLVSDGIVARFGAEFEGVVVPDEVLSKAIREGRVP